MQDADPLWYKDAIIYQLHVRAFCDSSGDGVGDFHGLTQKLEYLQDLGATAVWLLPFYPSPLRDDGYDIADFTGIHPRYGTLHDFKAFLREAHARGLKVITELVINHTSDQHPWFQRARQAKPGSRHRNFYVWSDTPEKYKDARIIFKDFEASNWTWDPVAGAYYWHRFYSHQPDLNYDNPEVRKAILQVLDHWLAMGVDGLRLDAVPYLFERDATNCENLPETHAFIREIRARMDRRYPGRMLLAEANQWPEDAVTYFGQGDECHTAFHFPVMPRMFMAVQMEDRFPIIDILQQTPDIPELCQWVLFLRNHDELTLEMVTDEERDYMYRVYAHNPLSRINLGIRRRLAPLLGNHRRKIELLNSLLLSLPGAPVIYYGDEIGMGDNIYLGDRNGVRTPMQWSPDRNAGFSEANPQQIYLPVNIDHEYHYEAVNVETSRRNPYSLFWWMKRLIALRQQTQIFSRGSLRFLFPENPRVLAYIRTYQERSILVVANLSRFSQFVELDLSEFRGTTPVELFGQTPFPRIGDLPYLLTLGPHSFYWFFLQKPVEMATGTTQETAPAARSAADLPVLRAADHWQNAFKGQAKRILENMLPQILDGCGWFSGKTKTLRSASITDVIPLEETLDQPAILFVVLRTEYAADEPETYLWPLGYLSGFAAAQTLGENPPWLVARLQTTQGDQTEEGVLFDVAGNEGLGRSLLEMIVARRRFGGKAGKLTGRPGSLFRSIREAAEQPPPARCLKAEPDSTNLAFGDQMLLKVYRRLEEGIHPEPEMAAFLTERANFSHALLSAGTVEYQPTQGTPATVAMLQGFIRYETDGLHYTLNAVSQFFDRVLTKSPGAPPLAQDLPHRGLVNLAAGEIPPLAREMCNAYLESAALLGRRTAELHLALAGSPEVPAFAPEPFSELYVRSLYQAMRAKVRRVFRFLRQRMSALPDDLRDDARTLLLLEQEIVDRFHILLGRKIGGMRIRCHGNYHLGRILFTGKDFVIVDLGGDPKQRISPRRIKRSPLTDAAGMIRSISAEAYHLLYNQIGGMVRKEELSALEDWTRFWATWTGAGFLKAYLETLGDSSLLPPSRDDVQILLDALMLEIALDELGDNLLNRSAAVRIPLQCIRRILEPRE